MPAPDPVIWIPLALIAAACVIAVLRAVASAIADAAAAHDLAVKVANLRIKRLEQLREFERQRAARSPVDFLPD